MEHIFVKCEPESEDDLNDQQFSVEHVKVRKIILQLANLLCQSQVP